MSTAVRGHARDSHEARPRDPFDGPGEMRAQCRAVDWAATPLGPVASWSAELLTTVQVVLDSGLPNIILWGRELIQIYNEPYSRIIAGKHPYALGRGNLEVWPEVWHINGPIYERVFAGETVTNFDVLYPLERKGYVEEVYLSVAFSPIRDARGDVAGVLANMLETTDQVAYRALQQRQAETLRQLEAERARLEYVFRQAPSFFTVLRGPDHVYEKANAAYHELVGGRDIIGRPLREALPELVEQGFVTILDRVLATGEPYIGREVPVQLQRGAGDTLDEVYVDFAFQPLVEADGTRSGIVVHGSIVTEHVQARREIEAIYDSAPIGLCVIDRDLRWVRINERLAEMNGVPVAAHLGRTVREVLPGIADAVETLAQGVIETGEPALDVEIVGETPARPGVTRTWIEQWLPIRDNRGVVTGINVVAQEVTEQREAAAERERLLAAAEAARRAAEEANRAKGEFLAVMSHELRTPLNAIGGYAELMEMGLRGPVTEHQREDLARIQGSQRHLMGLINQVLNYTRIETGTVRYELDEVPVAATLAAAESLVVPQMRAKGIAYEFPGCDPALALRADADKVRQILINLFTNAIKFTAPGGRVRVTCVAGETRVALSVADTGIGIEADKLASIFEPFVQVNAAFTRTNEGVGLGLAISRDLARGMGGDLTATSVPGAGSTFTLLLPRA